MNLGRRKGEKMKKMLMKALAWLTAKWMNNLRMADGAEAAVWA